MRKRFLSAIFLIGTICVIGTWFIIQNKAIDILHEQARSESLSWAKFVRSDLDQLQRILDGAPPTISDVQTLGTAKNIGNVVWFKIYDHDRSVVWSADFHEVGDINNEDYFTNKVLKGETHVQTQDNTKDKQTLTDAFLPIMDGESFKGAIHVTLNMTALKASTDQMANALMLAISSLFLILFCLAAYLISKEIQKEHRLTELAQQAAAARQKFITLISHELRTPLNGVFASLHLIKEQSDPFQKDHLTDIAISSSNHLKEVINDIIDFTQLTGQQQSLKQEAVNIHHLVGDIEKTFAPRAKEANLDFNIGTNLPSPCVGELDLKKFQKIISTLLDNAIKFTRVGSIDVRIILSQTKPRQLIIEVEDTGIGIAPENQEKIFKQFQQIEHVNSRHNDGMGLGLTLCQELVRIMNGKISLTSELDKGSLFSVALPFSETNAMDAQQEIIDPEKVPDLSILLVEDNAINTKVISTILKQSGHVVTCAENGKIAVRFCEDQHFDMIFMDYQMPIMNGLEATKHIRKGVNANNNTPIIALSANVMPEQQASYINAGMDGCLAKPIKPQELRQAVAKYYFELKR